MEEFLQFLVAGLAIGAVYALIALGFVAIYRASQVFNFAHGEFAMFGAFLMVTLVAMGLPWGFALLGAMTATGLLGAGIERGVLRPLVGRPVFVPIILTIFVGLVIRTAVVVFWGVDERVMPTPWDTRGSVEVFGAVVRYNTLATAAATVLALMVFYVLFQRSRLGIAMRASATDQEASLAVGIRVGSVFTRTWFIAGAMAALAGIFLAMSPRVVDTNLGFVALRAFPAILIGGLTSPLGAVIGGLLLGVLEVMAQGYVNPRLGTFGQGLHQVVAYLAMILVLLVRPYGLFGTREVQRV